MWTEDVWESIAKTNILGLLSSEMLRTVFLLFTDALLCILILLSKVESKNNGYGYVGGCLVLREVKEEISLLGK
jgi:hypothetical protein